MYVQDLYANMPYQSWEIVSHGPNHTLFTIVGGMVEVSVDIKVRDTYPSTVAGEEAVKEGGDFVVTTRCYCVTFIVYV